MANNSEQINHDNWRIIEAANWKNYKGKIDRGLELGQFRKAWFQQCVSQDLLRASTFARDKMHELSNIIENYEKSHGKMDLGGDDSYSDRLYHIVGLGEKVYNGVVNDPSTIVDFKVQESFSYMLFTNYDEFERFNEMHHQRRAYELYGELEIAIIDKEVSKKDDAVKDMKKRLYAMAHGDFKEATKGFDIDYVAMYDTIGKKFDYGFANGLSDAYKYMV